MAITKLGDKKLVFLPSKETTNKPTALGHIITCKTLINLEAFPPLFFLPLSLPGFLGFALKLSGKSNISFLHVVAWYLTLTIMLHFGDSTGVFLLTLPFLK